MALTCGVQVSDNHMSSHLIARILLASYPGSWIYTACTCINLRSEHAPFDEWWCNKAMVKFTDTVSAVYFFCRDVATAKQGPPQSVISLVAITAKLRFSFVRKWASPAIMNFTSN